MRSVLLQVRIKILSWSRHMSLNIFFIFKEILLTSTMKVDTTLKWPTKPVTKDASLHKLKLLMGQFLGLLQQKTELHIPFVESVYIVPLETRSLPLLSATAVRRFSESLISIIHIVIVIQYSYLLFVNRSV